MPVVPEEPDMDAATAELPNWDGYEPRFSSLSFDLDVSMLQPSSQLGLLSDSYSFDIGYDYEMLTDEALHNLEPSDSTPELGDHLADPCQQCRTNGYACKRIREGKSRGFCTSCVALRVDCSLADQGQEGGENSSLSSALHRNTAAKDIISNTADKIQGEEASDTAAEVAEAVATEAPPPPPTSAKVGARLSKESVKILKNWFAENSQHPYPTDEEKDSLQRLTNLSKVQITNWLANYRRRNKIAPPRSTSPSVNVHSLTSVDIPRRRATPAPHLRRPKPSHYENMNPLERWKNSPPEHEPASVNDIARAVSTASITVPSSISSPRSFSFTDDSVSLDHGSSASSLGTSRSSAGSFASAYSYGSRKSMSSIDRGRRRRRRRAIPKVPGRTAGNSLTQPANMYQCTFCPQTFKAKYDWQRHEKSLHLSLENWVCAPKGGKAFNPATSRIECVFCSEANPSIDHLETHDFAACHDKDASERTFYRKDHLRQHLRLVHNTKFVDWSMDSWEQKHDTLESSCGFCGMRMNTWTARVEHLAGHFKAGRTMADWKGDWGFKPSVIDKVQNAIPPYMVHEERYSPLPFAANEPLPGTPIHAYELLKTELEYWAQNYKEQFGKVPDDEEIQYEACRIVFGAEVLSRRGLASVPSWLRDLLMCNQAVVQRARLSPIRSVADSHLSVLRINGKDNIFESCPLEHQLLQYVTTRTLIGLTATDGELQQECCQILGRLEETSASPSELVGNLLIRLVKGSSTWLAEFRRRAHLPRSEDMIDEDRRPTDGKSLDSSIHNFSRLERELAAYVRAQRALGIEPDGPDLQRAARIIIYGNNDGWNQTAADSPQWVDAFRQRLLEADTRAVLQLSDPLHHLFDPDAELLAIQNSLDSQVDNNPSPVEDGNFGFPTASTGDVPIPTASPTSRCVPSIPYFIHDLNCYKRLEKELGRWVASTMSPHNPNQHVPSDAELQHQARFILFEDDDPWNATAADNFEWLRRFKRDHGILTDDSGPGLPDCVGWNVQHGGTGFAPPYAYPATALEGAAGSSKGSGTVQIPLKIGAKAFETDQRAVDSFLQGLKTRYPPPAAVFCSRELESGLLQLVQSQQLETGTFPSDETLRAKAREILGTESTAADDDVLLERFKAMAGGTTTGLDGVFGPDLFNAGPLGNQTTAADIRLEDVLPDFDMSGAMELVESPSQFL